MNKPKPFIDITTGVLLTPSKNGKECLGNGSDKNIECCCDECDFLGYCYEEIIKEMFKNEKKI